jgi:hypothetical protein
VPLLLTAAIALLMPATATAEVEVTSDLALGGGGLLYDDQEITGQGYDASEGVLRMGLNSSVVFLRDSNREFGLGLYVEVMTSDFRDVQPGAGMVFVFPIHHGFPLVIYAGAHYDYDGEHAAGFGGRVWWGAHNHNHHHPYNSILGIFFEVRGNVWGNQDVILAGGIDFDLHVFFTPWIWLARWIHGPERL